ncbi:MAG TPA: hypothetical protein VK003_10485 [Oceanobacillus sp.]|nr:hypothetical protein [Oceanobacillus sp.]
MEYVLINVVGIMALYPTITTEIPAYKSATAPRTQPQPRLHNMLGGLVVKLALALTGIFAASLALTHAQPYNGEDLIALITPPANCAMPCWNGIQPGVTTANDAAAILQADPNVADVLVLPGKISWWWNGEQSSLLDASGRAFHGRMETAMVNGQETITSIVLDTNVLLGDVRLTLGEPDSLTLHTVASEDQSQRSGIVHVAHYGDLYVFNMLECPMNVSDFWASPSYIAFGAPNLVFEGETFEYDSLPNWFFRDQAPGCGAL